MSLTRTGSIATAVLMTVVIAGCGTDEPAAGGTGTTPTAGPTTPTISTPTLTASVPPTPAGLTALPGKELIKKTAAAANAAESVHVRGTFVDDGGPMKVDLSLAKKGGSGTITLDGANLKVTVVGRTAYLQISDAMWRKQLKPKKADLLISLVGDKWIKLPLDNKDFGELIAFTSKTGFFALMFDKPRTFSKTGPKTIDGVPCIGLWDGKGTLWVDAANARPMRAENPGKNADNLTFSQYNQIKEPKAPPSSKVIDGKDIGM